MRAQVTCSSLYKCLVYLWMSLCVCVSLHGSVCVCPVS